MSVAKQLQLNIYVDKAAAQLDLYNKNFSQDIIYPIFYANQMGSIGGT